MDTITELSQLPENVSQLRQGYFDLALPFRVSAKDHCLFWSLVDNVYSVTQTRKPTFYAPYTTQYVECRFRRPTPQSGKPKTSNRRTVSKKKESTCDVYFKIIHFGNFVDIVGMPGGSTNHTHTLQRSDSHKRNSFIRRICQKEIMKGHEAATIFRALRSNDSPHNLARLDAIGGKFLTRVDIANLAREVRKANPNLPRVGPNETINESQQGQDAQMEVDPLPSMEEDEDESRGTESRADESRADKSRLMMDKILNNIRTRFDELVDRSNSLDAQARDLVFEKWDQLLVRASEAITGGTLREMLGDDLSE